MRDGAIAWYDSLGFDIPLAVVVVVLLMVLIGRIGRTGYWRMGDASYGGAPRAPAPRWLVWAIVGYLIALVGVSVGIGIAAGNAFIGVAGGFAMMWLLSMVVTMERVRRAYVITFRRSTAGSGPDNDRPSAPR